MRIKAAGHFAGILDTREINPWGIPGFYITIHRSGLQAWQDWLKANQGENPLARNITKETVRLSMANRRARKDRKKSEQELMDEAVTRATETAEPVEQIDVERMKDGVAEHLIARWRGVESALKECLDCHHRWAPDAHAQPCPECGSVSSVDVGEPMEPTPENKRALLDNEVDDNGNVRWVPKEVDGVEMQCGDQPWGDALMHLILEESNDTEAFRDNFVEAAKGN